MVDIWLASDHHIDHENIIRFCGRPFHDVVEMNQKMLALHNETVKPQDHVYFLGDVTLRRGGKVDREWFINEVKRYHGHKRLILGNHDHLPTKTYLEAGFEKIYGTWRGLGSFIMSHIPLHPTSLGSASANVHGHIHQNHSPTPVLYIDKEGRLKSKPYINVCLEATGYRPIHLDTVNKWIARVKDETEGVDWR